MHNGQQRSMFFSEEKNQKTSISQARSTLPFMAGNVPRRPGRKSLLVLFFRKEPLLLL
jgi:hypothetical protein